MSRFPTEFESTDAAWQEYNRRRGREEKLADLLYKRWSLNTLRAVDEKDGAFQDLPYAYDEELNPLTHGIVGPTAERKSKKVRKDRPKTGPLFVRLYGDL